MKSLNGKAIEDATEPLMFRVTARDVNKAKAKDPMTCAIARGLTHDGHVVSVRIGSKVALVEYKKKVVRYGLRPADTKKIRAFDNAHYFQPDSYTLIPPQIKLGKSTSGKSHSRKRGGSAKSVYRAAPLRHLWRVEKVAHSG